MNWNEKDLFGLNEKTGNFYNTVIYLCHSEIIIIYYPPSALQLPVTTFE